jgi:adenylate cyclase, class 2
MKEIEVKILDINKEQIRRKLKILKAEKIFSGEVHTISLDFPNRSLSKKNSILRLRRLGDKVELCFKGKQEKSNFKIRQEIETITDDFEKTLKIFENLGLKRFYEGKKHRESYRLGKTKFEIDTWPDIPAFLEIEAPTEKDVVTAVKMLGYNMNQATNLSGRELHQLYHRK